MKTDSIIFFFLVSTCHLASAFFFSKPPNFSITKMIEIQGQIARNQGIIQAYNARSLKASIGVYKDNCPLVNEKLVRNAKPTLPVPVQLYNASGAYITLDKNKNLIAESTSDVKNFNKISLNFYVNRGICGEVRLSMIPKKRRPGWKIWQYITTPAIIAEWEKPEYIPPGGRNTWKHVYFKGKNTMEIMDLTEVQAKMDIPKAIDVAITGSRMKKGSKVKGITLDTTTVPEHPWWKEYYKIDFEGQNHVVVMIESGNILAYDSEHGAAPP